MIDFNITILNLLTTDKKSKMPHSECTSLIVDFVKEKLFILNLLSDTMVSLIIVN